MKTTTIICVDNSELAREVFNIQVDFAHALSCAKSQANTENKVAILAMAGEDIPVLVTPTRDIKAVKASMQDLQIGGDMKLGACIQKAQSILNDAENSEKNIIAFVASPIKFYYKETLEFIGRDLKNTGIALDIVAFGEKDEDRQTKIEALIAAVNCNDRCHYINVLPDYTDLLMSGSPPFCISEFNLCEEKPDPMISLLYRVSMAAITEVGRDANETREDNMPSYVYISDGLVICCLDLLEGEIHTDAVPLKEIATVKLLERNLPISRGFFRLGTDVYMTGGHVIPGGYQTTHRRSPPQGSKLYASILRKNLQSGLSSSTSRVSLEGDVINLSGCNIGEMKIPKAWTVVEKINGLLHAFNCIPFEIDGWDWDYPLSENSHEVFIENQGWIVIPTVNLASRYKIIRSHLVVGNKMYAAGSCNFLLFDSTTLQWGSLYHDDISWYGLDEGKAYNPFRIQKVWHVLSFGKARCAGVFLADEFTDPLFVVIATISRLDFWFGHVVAYLVNSRGDIICFQRIPEFFVGSVQPIREGACNLISVDDDEKKLCTVVYSKPIQGLFITIFTVEPIRDSSAKVGRALRSFTPDSYAKELTFVEVGVRKKCIINTADLTDLTDFTIVQACFP